MDCACLDFPGFWLGWPRSLGAAAGHVMTAPGIPGEFDARASGDSVVLTWTTSSNSPDKYAIHRGTTRASLSSIGEVVPPATHYKDSGLEPNTYYYKVVASKGTETAETEIKNVTTSEAAVSIGLGTFLFYLAIVIGAIASAIFVVPFPTFAADASLESISGSVGAFLVRFGVILLVVAFVPALIEVLARTFHIRFRPSGTDGVRAAAASGTPLAEIILGVVGQFPELLRRPAGYGVASMLLGVILLVGAAFGFGGDEAAASPSPSPGVTTPAPPTASPGPGST